MRLSEYCSSQDIDRAIAVTVESFIGSQKVSCKKALSRAFAKYVLYLSSKKKKKETRQENTNKDPTGTHSPDPSRNLSGRPVSHRRTRIPVETRVQFLRKSDTVYG